jgi:hypothetical protein
MPILNGMTTDYAQDTGAFIVGSIITKGIYAINDIEPAFNPIDLTLGANGSINFVVGGGNNDNGSIAEQLCLRSDLKGQSNIYNFQAVGGNNAIALSPTDENSTVYIGDAVFYSDTNYVYLTSFNKKLCLLTDEIQLDGSLHSLQNLKIDGQMYTPEINITKHVESNSNLIGYAFRINDEDTLELIKYISTENNDKCQLIASFGKGDIINDTDYSFNKYVTNNSESNIDGNLETIDGSGGNDSVWLQSGNDIHFGYVGGFVQRVGINTNTPETPLHVEGIIKGTEFTDGVLEIKNGYLYNVTSIRSKNIFFEDIVSSGVGKLWDGHASNIHNINLLPLSMFHNDLYLSDFYTNTNTTWFDNEQSKIRLSQFSNDILDFGDEVTFCNVIITSTMNSFDNHMNTLFASNVSLSNVNVENASISNLYVHQDIITSSLHVNEISNSSLSNIDIITSNITASSISNNNDITTKSLVSESISTLTMTAIQNMITVQVEAQVAIIKDTLYASNLYVHNYVKGGLIPDNDITYDLGSANNRWKDLYLSGNSLYIDNVSLNVSQINDESTGHKQLNIEGASLKTEKIVFYDTTEMTSVSQVTQLINDGQIFGDFAQFNISINERTNEVESLAGLYKYSYNHDISTKGISWIIYDMGERNILPLLSDGSGINLSIGNNIRSGGSPNDIQLPFIYKRRFIGQNLIFAHKNELNPNEAFQIRSLDPFSQNFKNKIKADFHNYYNKDEIVYGNPSLGYTIYCDKTEINQYIQINNINDFNTKNGGTKFYDIEMMFYFNSPKFNQDYLLDTTMSNKYLTSCDRLIRLNKAYELTYDEHNDISTYSLKVINDNYGLFPRISIQKWDNSTNSYDFSSVLYTDLMGWGDVEPNQQETFKKFNNNGWLEQLFIITYLYIKHGDVFYELEDSKLEYLKSYYTNNISYNDIVYTGENDIIDRQGNTIETKTTFCLRKQAFENISTTIETNIANGNILVVIETLKGDIIEYVKDSLNKIIETRNIIILTNGYISTEIITENQNVITIRDKYEIVSFQRNDSNGNLMYKIENTYNSNNNLEIITTYGDNTYNVKIKDGAFVLSYKQFTENQQLIQTKTQSINDQNQIVITNIKTDGSYDITTMYDDNIISIVQYDSNGLEIPLESYSFDIIKIQNSVNVNTGTNLEMLYLNNSGYNNDTKLFNIGEYDEYNTNINGASYILEMTFQYVSEENKTNYSLILSTGQFTSIYLTSNDNTWYVNNTNTNVIVSKYTEMRFSFYFNTISNKLNVYYNGNYKTSIDNIDSSFFAQDTLLKIQLGSKTIDDSMGVPILFTNLIYKIDCVNDQFILNKALITSQTISTIDENGNNVDTTEFTNGDSIITTTESNGTVIIESTTSVIKSIESTISFDMDIAVLNNDAAYKEEFIQDVITNLAITANVSEEQVIIIDILPGSVKVLSEIDIIDDESIETFNVKLESPIQMFNDTFKSKYLFTNVIVDKINIIEKQKNVKRNVKTFIDGSKQLITEIDGNKSVYSIYNIGTDQHSTNIDGRSSTIGMDYAAEYGNNFKDIFITSNNTFILNNDKSWSCWGSRQFGLLGDNSNTNSIQNTKIDHIELNNIKYDIKSFYASDKTIYVLKSDGKLYGMGQNTQYALGIGNNTTNINTFTNCILLNALVDQGWSIKHVAVTVGGIVVCYNKDNVDKVYATGKDIFNSLGTGVYNSINSTLKESVLINNFIGNTKKILDIRGSTYTIRYLIYDEITNEQKWYVIGYTRNNVPAFGYKHGSDYVNDLKEADYYNSFIQNYPTAKLAHGWTWASSIFYLPNGILYGVGDGVHGIWGDDMATNAYRKTLYNLTKLYKASSDHSYWSDKANFVDVKISSKSTLIILQDKIDIEKVISPPDQNGNVFETITKSNGEITSVRKNSEGIIITHNETSVLPSYSGIDSPVFIPFYNFDNVTITDHTNVNINSGNSGFHLKETNNTYTYNKQLDKSVLGLVYGLIQMTKWNTVKRDQFSITINVPTRILFGSEPNRANNYTSMYLQQLFNVEETDIDTHEGFGYITQIESQVNWSSTIVNPGTYIMNDTTNSPPFLDGNMNWMILGIGYL